MQRIRKWREWTSDQGRERVEGGREEEGGRREGGSEGGREGGGREEGGREYKETFNTRHNMKCFLLQ